MSLMTHAAAAERYTLTERRRWCGCWDADCVLVSCDVFVSAAAALHAAVARYTVALSRQFQRLARRWQTACIPHAHASRCVRLTTSCWHVLVHWEQVLPKVIWEERFAVAVAVTDPIKAISYSGTLQIHPKTGPSRSTITTKSNTPIPRSTRLEQLWFSVWFLPRDGMLARYMLSLCVCPSVCPTVTRRYYVQTT